MYNYKALLIKISDTTQEKICSTAEQACVFLKKCNVPVTNSSKKHLERIFSVINMRHIRPDGEANHSFSDGSDGENPTILVYNYTGHYSRIEFSPNRLQVICNGLVDKYKKIEPDFNINVSTDIIDGGFYWQWSDQQQAKIAIHDFSVRICYYGNLRELEAAIDQVADRLITRYSKKSLV
jgi:hypothetical protein